MLSNYKNTSIVISDYWDYTVRVQRVAESSTWNIWISISMTIRNAMPEMVNHVRELLCVHGTSTAQISLEV